SRQSRRARCKPAPQQVPLELQQESPRAQLRAKPSIVPNNFGLGEASEYFDSVLSVYSVVNNYRFGKTLPPYCAASPSCSSIRRSWLYLAIRSLRDALPVLIWPVLSATAKSAIVASSVSPLRWLITLV